MISYKYPSAETEEEISWYENWIALYKILAGASVAVVGGFDAGVDIKEAEKRNFVIHINQHFIRRMCRVDGLYQAAAEPIEFEGFDDKWFMPAFLLYGLEGGYKQEYANYAKRKELIHFPVSAQQHLNCSPSGAFFQWSNVAAWQMGAKPFTGMLAVYHLAMFPVTEIFITGMDFHMSSDAEDPRGKKQTWQMGSGEIVTRRGPHAIEPQLEWLREYARQDGRIEVDDYLAGML